MKKFAVITVLIAMSLMVSSCDLREVIGGVTVSGKVTYDGQHTYPHTFVFLMTSPSDTGGIDIANGMIVDQNGNYTIYRVENGVYYLFAIADTNNNLMPDPADPIGWFGHPDTIADSIIVTVPDSIVVSGEDLTNIDIDTMYVVPSTK